jgi:hypothetical protein
MSREMEQRFLKDLIPESVKTPQEVAPEPVVTLFKSWTLNVIEAVDPVSGQRVISLVFTAGNYSQQFIVNMNTLQIASLMKVFQEKLGPQNGDNTP